VGHYANTEWFNSGDLFGMKHYYRVMLGRKSVFAAECFEQSFIGVDFDIRKDLTHSLTEDWRSFNREFIPIFLSVHPTKSKIAAGLACGFLWTVAKGIKVGDTVISPNGEGVYRVGEVTGEYFYQADTSLPHRRRIHWLPQTIAREDMSNELRSSTGSIGTVSRIDGYADEIERLVGGNRPPIITTTDSTIEDPSVFALERHLEDFLVANWAQTELGRDWDIFEEDGEVRGQQYPTDTGPIDILAISKDKTRLLVVELKKGRASDAVVGQIQRYMGYVKEELAESGQSVEGVIIALEDDLRIKRALVVAAGIRFFRYQVSFKLLEV
jgi:restriction system protein